MHSMQAVSQCTRPRYNLRLLLSMTSAYLGRHVRVQDVGDRHYCPDLVDLVAPATILSVCTL
jgi:hypothetical protein